MKKILFIACLLLSIASHAQKPELIIPTGHEKSVENIVYSGDGKYLLSASENYVKIWERSSGRLLKNITCKWGDKEPLVVDMDASPDGKIVAAATYLNIHFISMENLSVKSEMHFDEIAKVLFDKDGSHLFVAHGDDEKIVSVIDMNTGSSSDIFKQKKTNDKSDISNLSLSKDGKQLLLCMNKDGSVILNSTSGAIIKTIPAEKRVISFTPDGSLLSQKKGSGSYEINFDWLDASTLQPKWTGTVGFRKEDDGTFDWLVDEYIDIKKQCAWNPVTNDLVVASEKHLFVVSYSNRSVTQLKYKGGDNNKSIAIPADGKQVSIGNSKPAVFDYNFNKQAVTHNYGSAVFVTGAIQTTNDSSFQVLLNSENGNINDLRFGKTNFTSNDLLVNNSFSVSAISRDGKLGAYFFQHTLHFFNPATMQDNISTIDLDQNLDLHELSFSDNGKWLAAVDAKYVVIFDVVNKKLINKIATGEYDLAFRHNYKIASISNDGKKLVTYSIKENSNGNGAVLCYDIATGNQLWQKSIIACCFKFISADKQVFMVVKDNPSISIVDVTTGNSVSEKSLPFDGIYTANISSDMKRLAFTTVDKYFTAGSNDIQVWDIAKNESTAVLKGHEFLPGDLGFLANSNFLISSSIDNSTRIWDIRNQKELGKIVTFEGSDEWVFITPDGRFDASPGALQTMYYTKGKDVLPLEALYEQYYTPKLVSRLLAGEQFDPVPDIGNIKVRPSAKMSYAAATRNLDVEDDVSTYQNTTGVAEITVTANAPDDSIDEIRLFQNGKVVTLSTRNLIVADDNTANTAIKKYTVNLLPGENTFRAVALNTQRTESKPDEIAIIYNAATTNNNAKPVVNNTDGSPVAPVDKNATMHLIVVGINQYQNKTLSLNYALADATSFKDEVEKDAKTFISNVKTYFVKDNDADKSGIENAFKEVKQNAKPEDVFVFYYAGHGVIGKDKEFYLVPTDVSDLKNVQSELEQKGIAAKMLQQYAIDIQAQKQLFILDACQSAGAFEAMLSNDANQQKSIAVVARSTGTHWIAASGAQQFANEFSSLGHGAFTYVLLDALKGAAVSNNMITVNNLKNYLQQTVPELMKKYHGTPQYPASYGFGNDFPVEVKN